MFVSYALDLPYRIVCKDWVETDGIRPVDAAHGFGIDTGDDLLTIGGAKFNIIRVDGLKWLDSEPSVLRFTLRGVN